MRIREGARLALLGTAAVAAAVVLLAAPASAAPSNDNFANAHEISGRTGQVGGSNVGATYEEGEYGAWRGTGSVWYRWTAPESGRFVFWTEDATMSPYVAVWTGSSIASRTLVASDSWSGLGTNARLAFDAVKDTTYRISVEGTWWSSGAFTLRWGPEARITGTVINRSDAPIVDVCVQVYWATAEEGAGSTRTDSEGKFSVGSLSRGSFKVRYDDCSAEGYLPKFYINAPDHASATHVMVESGETQGAIDVVLDRGGRIEGVLRDSSGTLVPDRCLRAFTEQGGGWRTMASAFSDHDGRYSLRGLPSGTYAVQAYRCLYDTRRYLHEYYDNAYSFDDRKLVAADLEHTTGGIDFRLEVSGVITGRVVDTAGEPIHGAGVSASADGGHHGGTSTYTDQDGVYRLDMDLYPGTYVVWAWHQAYLGPRFHGDTYDWNEAGRVPLPVEGTTAGVDVVLNRPSSITGRIVGEDGTAIHGACVGAYDTDSGQSWTWWGVYSDQTGTYVVNGLYPGTYKLAARPDCSGVGKYGDAWHGGATFDEARAFEVGHEARASGIDVVVPLNASISGTVTAREDGRPLEGVCAAAASPWGWTSASGVSDASGVFTIYGVPEGSWLVELTDCREHPRYLSEFVADTPGDPDDRAAAAEDARVFEVSGRVQLTGADEDLLRGASISGTVTDHAGNRLDDICVAASHEEAGFTSPSTRSAGGAYRLGALEAGSYIVHFWDCVSGRQRFAPEYHPGVADRADAAAVAVVRGADTPGIDAVMDAPGSVVGRVTDSSGRPLRSMCVGLNTGPGGGEVAQTLTGPDGRYVVGGGANGTHYVRAWDCALGEYLPAWYETAAAPGHPAPVDIDSRPEGVSIGDIELPRGGTVAGTITGRAGRPLAGVCVEARPESASPGGPWSSALTASDGRYRIAGLPTVTVTVHARDCGAISRYDPAVYRASGWLTPTPVAAVVETDTTGIDIALEATLAVYSLGDAIAAGTGLPGEAGPCRQSPAGFGARLGPLLGADFTVVDSKNLACYGARANATSPGPNDLQGQVDALLAHARADRWTIVTITAGWHDLGLGDVLAQRRRLCDDTDTAFANYVIASRIRIATGVAAQVPRILSALPRGQVMLTELYQPLNADPVYLDSPAVVGSAVPPLCDDDAPGHRARLRMERLIAEVNAGLAEVVTSLPLGQQARFELVPIEEAFRDHEAAVHPSGYCGGRRPAPSDTWLQYPPDGYDVRQTGSRPGDCLYPNDTGAQAIANILASEALPATPPSDIKKPRMTVSHQTAAVLVSALGDHILVRVDDSESGVGAVLVKLTSATTGQSSVSSPSLNCVYNARSCWFAYRPPQGAWKVDLTAVDRNDNRVEASLTVATV